MFLAVAVLAVVLISAVLFERDRAQLGVQLDSPSLSIELAEATGWQELLALGDSRSGFPAPMVWRLDELCIGFSRVDFGPTDRRPTLARCAQGGDVGDLEPWEIVSIATVVSGLDTWHFIEASDTVQDVQVSRSDGVELSGDRVHLAGSMVALRLPNDVELSELRWSVGNVQYRCSPGKFAWRDSLFCP